MSSLFADTHNVVAILKKSDAAEGFEQIIDFLSDVTRLQALVDKKKIVISEVAIREILQLDDDKCIVCLPNEEIFAGLAQIGYEKPSNKLTFYKAFFSKQPSPPQQPQSSHQTPPQGADLPTHIQQILDLITDVVTAASQVSATSATISAAKPSILAAAPTVVAAYTKRRKGVIIRDLEEELSLKTPAETPAETSKVKDKGKGIMVETLKPMKKKDQI
nr:hypothetical protein [Tanacetum cinerariifolium]